MEKQAHATAMSRVLCESIHARTTDSTEIAKSIFNYNNAHI